MRLAICGLRFAVAAPRVGTPPSFLARRPPVDCPGKWRLGRVRRTALRLMYSIHCPVCTEYRFQRRDFSFSFSTLVISLKLNRDVLQSLAPFFVSSIFYSLVFFPPFTLPLAIVLLASACVYSRRSLTLSYAIYQLAYPVRIIPCNTRSNPDRVLPVLIMGLVGP